MRLGVIGCGNISLKHHLPAMKAEPGVKVVAAADATPVRLAMFGAAAGLDASACFADAADLIARADVDAVLVATPPRYRPAIVLAALAAGKHVLSEKPIALTPAEGWQMASAARSAGLRLAMVHNYYVMPDFVAVKRVLDSGVIGAPYIVTLNYLGVKDNPGAAEYQPVWRHDPRMSGGGVLMDMLHAVYILSWLLGGQPFRSVSAAVDRRLDDRGPVEDVALCRFHFDTGFGLINMAWGQGPGGIEVMGSEGRLLLFYRSFGTGPFEPPEQLHVFRGSERVPVTLDLQPSLGMRAILRDFVDSVEQSREPIAPGEQGCATLEAVVGAYASAARQENVTLPLDHTDPVYYRGISALLESEHNEERGIWTSIENRTM
jgi:UDP-N-acetyl-2-amino-2-deoxyglucuronate dehydrogenase